MTGYIDDGKRWLALTILCLGDLMIVLDTTIVNVALPSIRADLGFSQTALVWVVNAYMLTFGGFLLLGGRLGDLFGHRRLFLLGIALFTFASLACGLAASQALLIAAKLVMRFGARLPLGMLLVAAGLAWFARAPVAGGFVLDVLPGVILLGLGAGIAFNPVLLAAMSDVAPSESGLASGIVNTAFMTGGALGLAILASLAAARTDALAASGVNVLTALNGGYRVAFAVGAVCASGAALIALLFLGPGQPASAQEGVPAEY